MSFTVSPLEDYDGGGGGGDATVAAGGGYDKDNGFHPSFLLGC